MYKKSSGYFATSQPDLSKSSSASSTWLHNLLISKGIKTGTLLDIGCSTGQFIYHLKTMGWQVYGIDVNAEAVQIGKKHNLEVHAGTLEDAPYQKNYFDVITMGDTIEHVPSPRQLLTFSYDLLGKDGILFINTPNAKCGFASSTLLLSKFFKFPWPHSEAPYHLYEFSPAALSQLLTSIGYDVIYVKYEGSNSFFYTVGATGFFDDLKASMKLTGRYKFNFNFFKRIPLLTLISLILLPFFIFGKIHDQLLQSGSKFHLLARKSHKTTI